MIAIYFFMIMKCTRRPRWGFFWGTENKYLISLLDAPLEICAKIRTKSLNICNGIKSYYDFKDP